MMTKNIEDADRSKASVYGRDSSFTICETTNQQNSSNVQTRRGTQGPDRKVSFENQPAAPTTLQVNRTKSEDPSAAALAKV